MMFRFHIPLKVKQGGFKVLTYFFLALVLGSVHVRQCVRAQDGAHRGGPLCGHELVLPQQNLPDVVRSGHAHRGVSEEVCAVDVTVLLPLHPQELPPLQNTDTHTNQYRMMSKQ